MANSSAPSYQKSVLHRTDAFEVAACEWIKSDVFSAPLGPSWRQCSTLVQDGRFESRLDLGLKTETQVLEEGQTITAPLGSRIELRCLSPRGRTLHVHTSQTSNEPGGEERKKFSTPSLEQIKDSVDLKLGPQAATWSELENSLKQITDNSISTSSPYFMNQLFSGVFPETLASESIINQFRTTLATFEASPALTAVELEVIDRLCELVGWAEQARDGVGVSGGSAANFMAIHCARHQKVPEFRKRGPQGERFKIFVSNSAHYSLRKACLATGLGTDALVSVETDPGGRMKPDHLSEVIVAAKSRGEIPLLVCATAGTTVGGAFDPIDSIAEICGKFSVWHHVDAAWGGPVLFSTKARSLMNGVHRADSVTFDAHKLFGSRLTSSFFLTRHQGLLRDANDSGGDDYLFHSATTDLDRGRLSWQCGRGAEALSFWSLWKLHGTSGLGEFVDRLLSVRDESVRWIKTQPELSLVSEPAFLNICVRIGNDRDAAIKARDVMKADDFAFVNFSGDHEGSFLRLILAHPKVDFQVVQSILQRAIASTK